MRTSTCSMYLSLGFKPMEVVGWCNLYLRFPASLVKGAAHDKGNDLLRKGGGKRNTYALSKMRPTRLPYPPQEMCSVRLWGPSHITQILLQNKKINRTRIV